MRKLSAHILAGLLCLVAGSAIVRAQLPSGFSGKRFALPIQDRKTSELKAILTGQNAKQTTGSKVLVTDFGMRTFRKGNTNDVELIAAAPECLVDQSESTATSAGRIVAYTASTNFYIEGEGFLFQQTNSLLIISNKVQTIIRKEFLKSSEEEKNSSAPASLVSGETGESIKIFANHVEFLYESNLVQYVGNVRVEDPQMELTCDSLNIFFTTNKTLRQISAENRVVILHKQDNSRATGDRATYTVDGDEEMIALMGSPFWSDGQQEGKADVFTFDRKLGIFRAENNAVFKLSRDKIGGPEFLGAGSPGITNSRTDKSVTISADTVSFTIPGTNRLSRQMMAEKNVVITSEEDQSRATAGKAVYDESTGIIELTEKPVWKIRESEIAGEILTIDKTNRFFGARTNVQMKIPASLFGKALAGGKPLPAQTNSPVEIFADHFSYGTNFAVFLGNVRANALDVNLSKTTLNADRLQIGFGQSNQVKSVVATHNVVLTELPGKSAQTDVLKKSITCESLTLNRSIETGWVENIHAMTNVVGMQIKTLTNGETAQRISAQIVTIQFIPATNQIERVIAEQNVFAEKIDFLAGKEKISQAHGQLAVYDSAADHIELTGQPTARIDNWLFHGSTIFRWDFKTGKISASGANRGEAVNSTNDLRILIRELQP